MPEKTALLYARVSTNRQAKTGYSLGSQSKILIEKAEGLGYSVELIVERGSGRRASRPKLNDAIKRLNKGEAEALFVLDVDRLSRSTRHALEVAEMAKKNKWRLVILSLDIDTATASGKMVLSQLAIFAEFESSMTSERVKRQHEARRERGIVWGVDEGFISQLDPMARDLIVTEFIKGSSLRQTVRALQEAGLKTARGGQWHASTVKSYLDSPVSKNVAEEKARRLLEAKKLKEKKGAE
jgi:DNA invertase Pin-like site-specific DNA recombinase